MIFFYAGVFAVLGGIAVAFDEPVLGALLLLLACFMVYE
jgi:hypothetical protein